LKATAGKVVEDFFDDVAQMSKLPVVIYNFLAVCNGVDLDSETITRIAGINSNVVGVKLTCASVGKITRLATSFKPEEFANWRAECWKCGMYCSFCECVSENSCYDLQVV